MGRRFLAWLIDGGVAVAVMTMVLLAASAVATAIYDDADIEAADAAISLMTLVGFIAAMGLYYGFTEGAHGQTLGKRALRLRVVDASGSPPGLAKGIARYFARYVSGIAVGIGYLVAFSSPTKEAWHDSLTKTRVVALVPVEKAQRAARTIVAPSAVGAHVLTPPAAAPPRGAAPAAGEQAPAASAPAPEIDRIHPAPALAAAAHELRAAFHYEEAAFVHGWSGDDDRRTAIEAIRWALRGAASRYALERANTMLVTSPQDAALLALRVRALAASGLPDAATEGLKQLLAAAPGAVDTLVAAAWTTDDVKLALESAERAVGIARTDETLFALQGAAYRAERYGLQEEVLRELVAAAPTDPVLHVQLAASLHKQDRPDEAVAETLVVLRLDPSSYAGAEAMKQVARNKRAAKSLPDEAKDWIARIGWEDKVDAARRANDAPLVQRLAGNPVSAPGGSALNDDGVCRCDTTMRLHADTAVRYARHHLGWVEDLSNAGAVFACPATGHRWQGYDGRAFGAARLMRVAKRVESADPRPIGAYL